MTLFETGPIELLPFDGSAILYEHHWDQDESRVFEQEIQSSTPWQQPLLYVFGREVEQPRLTAWFGDPGKAYSYSGTHLEPLPWTPTLNNIRSSCERIASHSFNSVLVNLYRDGQDGVAWHADNEPELGPSPVIASVSFGATRAFHLRHRESKETIKIDLNSGSLLIMSGLSQSHWVHQIPKTSRTVGPRINLTFRTIYV
jgi:alkylated DNA repair dioxygenase AlkB